MTRPGTILSQTPRKTTASNMSCDSAIAGREGDDVAREQRQLHAGAPLRHAVAHGGHAARDLRNAARLARGLLENRRERLIGLMRRQHVVIGGDDGEIGHDIGAQFRLVVDAAGGEAMGEIGATERAPARPRAPHGLHPPEIGRAGRTAALDDTRRHVGDYLLNHGASRSCLPCVNWSGAKPARPVRRRALLSSSPRTSCVRRARRAPSPRPAPRCRRDSDAAPSPTGSTPPGSDRPSARPPRPRRGA